MLRKDLFHEVLIKPASESYANRIVIVTANATPTMAQRHIEALENSGREIRIKLICGMTPVSGISIHSHLGFRNLVSSRPNRFECSYVRNTSSPIHANVYVWCRDSTPVRAFLGSANYVQDSWGPWAELMHECKPESAYDFALFADKHTIYCNHSEVEDHVRIQREDPPFGAEEIRLSLLAGDGTMPKHSGLNWGHRANYNRDRNQAYLAIPAQIRKQTFFPPPGTFFTVHTDDGRFLICVRRQQGGKAIQTPLNNGLLGEYFRNRLGLESGAFVTKEDLLKYGRTDVTFIKIDEEEYYMDFSV